MRRMLAVCSMLLLVGASSAADSPAPVTDVSWKELRSHTTDLLRGLKAAGAALPAQTEKNVQALVSGNDEGVEGVQKLLDAHCLIAIAINPESRVKAARGPADADLVKDRPRLLLVKVHNEAGVTTALRVTGDEIRRADDTDAGRWLDAEMIAPAPLPKSLTGQKVQYVLLKLTARQAGKREATLRFDAGQGTQDLGFRAEVPILFRIK